jgi:hypothetical protein
MSGEKDEMIFHVRGGRSNDISGQEREIKSDSISEEDDQMTFHVRRGR